MSKTEQLLGSVFALFGKKHLAGTCSKLVAGADVTLIRRSVEENLQANRQASERGNAGKTICDKL